MFKNQNPIVAKHHTKYYIFGVILIVICLSVLAMLTYQHDNPTETSARTEDSASKQTSMFIFDTAGAMGWHKGPSNKTSLALFSNDNSCFVSVEFKTGIVDVTKEANKLQASLAQTGNAIKQYAVVPLSMAVNGVNEQYNVSQYSVTSPEGPNKLYGGQEYGYLNLPDGSMHSQGYCNTPDQLPTTLDAFRSITLNT